MHIPEFTHLTHGEIVAMLSEDMQQFASLLSRPDLITFLEVFGGTRIHVPARNIAESCLARVLGLEAATRLSKLAACERIYVPNLHNAFVKRRHSRIVRLCDEGWLIDAIAREVGLSDRQVFNVLAKAGKRTLRVRRDCMRHAALPVTHSPPAGSKPPRKR